MEDVLRQKVRDSVAKKTFTESDDLSAMASLHKTAIASTIFRKFYDYAGEIASSLRSSQ